MCFIAQKLVESFDVSKFCRSRMKKFQTFQVHLCSFLIQLVDKHMCRIYKQNKAKLKKKHKILTWSPRDDNMTIT